MRTALLLLAALPVAALALVGAAAPAVAGPNDGRIDLLRARLDPAGLPEGKGRLVVEATIREGLHLYAEGDEAMRFRPIPAPGVRYGLPDDWTTPATLPEGVELTPPHPYHDAELDETYPVYEGRFVLSVPIEVGLGVASDTLVGIVFEYSGCTSETCYGWVRNHKATVKAPPPGRAVPPEPVERGEGTPTNGGDPVPDIEPVPTPPPGLPADGMAPVPEKYKVPIPGGCPEGRAPANLPPDDEQNLAERTWNEMGIFFLGLIFLVGVALAFTPCVLPLIPITVSVIGGGRTDIPKRRLAVLLATYSAGMSIAFGILGLAASFGGASISVAFEIPAVQVAIAVLFVFFAIGMLGIVELQPPAWLVNLQGGAQKKAGSLLGAFLLGVVAAVLASPCTGPVIAGMFVLAAKLGSAPLGFLMFFTLGLGMAAVLFAFGALNFAAKPGPWMVWVRYAFAVILSGVALYYLANAEILSPTLTFVSGFLLAALFWLGVAWHLRRKEGAPAGVANVRGAKIAVLVVLATAVVAFLTKPPPDLGWTKLRDVAHLEQEIERSVARGRPVVVDIWATWCKNCKKFEHLIAEDEELKARFRQLTLLKIDVTNDPRDDLRWALGMVAGQPQMVFVDRTGLARRSAYIPSWKGTEESRKMLRHSLAVVLDEADAPAPR